MEGYKGVNFGLSNIEGIKMLFNETTNQTYSEAFLNIVNFVRPEMRRGGGEYAKITLAVCNTISVWR